MPNYLTHAIMAEKINIDSPIQLDKSLIRSYAIGQDLMTSQKGALKITHNTKTKEFFINLVSYIKEKHLEDNTQVMSYLYGHILHYYLDQKVHPYVYYITNDIDKKGIVDFHMSLEEYIGFYLSKTILGTTREKISSKFYTDFRWDKSEELKLLIDNLYEKTYGIKSAFLFQQTTGNLLKLLDGSTKMFQKDNGKNYFEIIGLNLYLKFINLKRRDIANEKHSKWYNPITEESSNNSVIELLESAISDSKELINTIQKVIYENEPIEILSSYLNDSSYDTGLSCEIGKPFKRSRIKDILKKRHVK